MHRAQRAANMLAVVSLLLGAAVCAQTAFRAPESIRVGLSVMSQVVANTGQLIAARRYDQIPVAAREFEAGMTALQQGLGDQPSPLQTQIVPLLARARVAASAMSEAVTAHRDSMLPVAHEQLADAVQSIIALFPQSLRPAPAGAAAQAPRNIR